MQRALDDVGAVPLLAVRFLLASAILAPAAYVVRRRRATTGRLEPEPGLLRASLLCGAALLAGYLFQTIGLQHTDTSRSAFVTYLLVVIVPVLAAVILRRPPTRPTVVGVVLATSGLVLLNGGITPDRGTVLTLGCAFFFAVHILLLAELAPRYETLRFTALQLFVVGAACLPVGIFFGGYRFTTVAWAAAAGTAFFASVLAFSLQIWGQRVVGPTRTSLLLMLEPVAAAALGWFVGERLGWAGWAGATLILAGIAVAEIAGAVTPSPHDDDE